MSSKRIALFIALLGVMLLTGGAVVLLVANQPARSTPVPETLPAPHGCNTRLLAGPWGRTWLLTVTLGVAALGTWEGYWRTQGFEPSRVSDEALWVLAREKLGGGCGSLINAPDAWSCW